LAVLALSVLPALAETTLPTILAARVSTTQERGRLVVDLSATTEYAIVSLDDPPRIAVDVKASGVTTIAPQPPAGIGIVTAFQTRMADESRARTELYLSKPAAVQQAYILDPIGDQPARLVVDLVTTTAEDFKARAVADLANSVGTVAPGTIAADEPPSTAPSSTEVANLTSSEPPPPEPESPTIPSLMPDGSRPLIVLDPGHGGIDNGATAPSGIHEKDITLAFALQLRDMLVKSGHFDVALTRDDDTYLTLNERVNLARQNRADLFISLHADTFQQSDIHGASIYTRDEQATDILDKILADGENRADIVAGYVPPDVKPAVVDILVDLMRRQVRQQAYIAASDIVKAMQPSVTLRRFPVRQADFYVLQAPDIPSMLVELGFLSNKSDIDNLENDQWRDKVVKAIADGVDAYFLDMRVAAQ
jgi:N-acetylmuramoyl-L-alanine amidase